MFSAFRKWGFLFGLWTKDSGQETHGQLRSEDIVIWGWVDDAD